MSTRKRQAESASRRSRRLRREEPEAEVPPVGQQPSGLVAIESHHSTPPAERIPRLDRAASIGESPPVREESSSVRPEGQGGPQPPPQAAVPVPPPPPAVDYQAIAMIITQALQQWRPPVAPPTAPPPPPPPVVPVQLPQTSTKTHFKAMKDADLPTFDGGSDPLKAESWMEEAEECLDLLEVPMDMRTQVIKPFLVGNAGKWWKTTMGVLSPTGQGISWEAFKEAFFENYFPMSLRAQKVDEFHALRQTETMTVVEYAHQFQSLGQYSPAIMKDEAAKMYRFKAGLRAELHNALAISRPTTYKEMYDAAVHYESSTRGKDKGVDKGESSKKARIFSSPSQYSRPSGVG